MEFVRHFSLYFKAISSPGNNKQFVYKYKILLLKDILMFHIYFSFQLKVGIQEALWNEKLCDTVTEVIT